MSILNQVQTFLKQYSLSSQPFLLALSGGYDSMCLFYCLLICRTQGLLTFHIAHVNHGWREESKQEAELLRQLAADYQTPYHEKTLDPALMTGNLEAACREARYAFFSDLCQEHAYQGVILGHQRDDLVETILKRVLEGSYWAHFEGLKAESWLHGMRLLRPLLGISKKDIHAFLQQKELAAFDDATNRDERFLRSRMRKTLLPFLNQTFGKQVESALLHLKQDMSELKNYLDNCLSSSIAQLISGPFGSYLDLKQSPLFPLTLVEIKHLIRLVCENERVAMTRPLVQQIATALLEGKADLAFEVGDKKMWVDRYHFFILRGWETAVWQEGLSLVPGLCEMKGRWKIQVNQTVFSRQNQAFSWREAWKGSLKGWLPLGNYWLGSPALNATRTAHRTPIRKWWANHQVPAFLRPFFPVVWSQQSILYEFLTGKISFPLKEGEECLEVEIVYC